jgi:hypothetical protein
MRVVELPVHFIKRQPFLAAFVDDREERFGVLHYAYLPFRTIV